MKLKITQKIIFIVLVIILFFGSIAAVAVYFQAKNILTEKQTQNLSVILNNEAELVAKDFSYVEKLVLTVATQSQLQQYLSQSSPLLQSPDILNFLSSYNLNQDYSAIYLMDVKGDTLVSTDESFIGNNYSFRPYFKQAQANKIFSYVAVGVTSHQPGYYFSTLIKDSLGQKLGVLVFKLKPDIIHQSVHQEKGYSGGLVTHNSYLIDQYGVVVYSTKSEKIFKSLGELSDQSQKMITEDNIYPDLSVDPLTYQPVQDKLSTIDQVSIFTLFDQDDQEQEMVLVKKINSYPFYLMIEAPLEDIQSDSNSVALIISLLVAAAALFAFIIILLFLRKILSPLQTITRVSQDIINGRLDQRVLVKTNDEFSILADNFNHVTDSLIKANQNIQNKVNQKTADLQKINRYMVNRELKMIELKKQIQTLKKHED